MKMTKFILAGVIALQAGSASAFFSTGDSTTRTHELMKEKQKRDQTIRELKQMSDVQLEKQLEDWSYILNTLQLEIKLAKESSTSEDSVVIGAGSGAVAIMGYATKIGAEKYLASINRLINIAGKGTRMAGLLLAFVGAGGTTIAMATSGADYVFTRLEISKLEREVIEAQKTIDILREALAN